MEEQKIQLDGIHWCLYSSGDIEPLCPKHNLRLRPGDEARRFHWDYTELYCEECAKPYTLPRYYSKETQYIRDKIDSKEFKSLKLINLDDEAIPLAEDKVKTKDGKYFVTALLTESKVGKRLVIYAGEKGKNEKCQIFVEPEVRRLSFDQKDIHPNDVFLEVQAKFKDGGTHQIKNN
ncbi:MAG: hypothetical protein ABSF55_00045 [Candidatus Staskawiczbacteria bacterium]|jgi:hypothetical protein